MLTDSRRLPIETPEPAERVYFDDPDGHSLEFIALLDDPPRAELGTVPLSQWRALHA